MVKRHDYPPENIAMYLKYKRPNLNYCTYPRANNPIDHEVRQLFFTDYAANSAYGDLKEEYRTMNRVLHYNLYPRGMEKTPGDKELEFLYMFTTWNVVVDYALWIFDQLV